MGTVNRLTYLILIATTTLVVLHPVVLHPVVTFMPHPVVPHLVAASTLVVLLLEVTFMLHPEPRLLIPMLMVTRAIKRKKGFMLHPEPRLLIPMLMVTRAIKTSIVTIGSMKTDKTFFLAFPALNSTAMNKKLKYSNSYLIVAQIHTCI